MLIYGWDRELARWAGDILGIPDFGPCVAIGVSHRGQIVAAAIYNQYRPPNIQVTFVTTSPWDTSPWSPESVVTSDWHLGGGSGVAVSVALKVAANQPVQWLRTDFKFQRGMAL